MGGGRHLLLAVAGAVLATSGVVVIVGAVTAQTPLQPPLSAAGSLELPMSVVSTEVLPIVEPAPTPAPQPPPASSAVPEEVDDPLVLSSSEPVAIDIPAIEVSSELQHLGLTAQRTLEVPAPGPRYNDAAWYKYSATPGAPGPAIILGHVDSAAEGPSVFFNLGELRPGEEILVTRADGMVAVFRVDTVGRYLKDDFPTDLVYGDTDHAALRLITCGGVFDRANGRYLDNIVVFASLVGSHKASQDAISADSSIIRPID